MGNATFKDRARGVLDPIVGFLARTGVSPMLVSVFGLVLSVYAAVVVAKGSLFTGALWLLVGSLCDVLDGSLARRLGRETRFGAFIDSTLDRVAELALFGGILVYLMTRPGGAGTFTIVVTVVAMAGSVLISYARARLEGLGYSCKVGWLERPERMTILLVGLILGSRVLTVALVVLAIGTVVTVAQRVLHGYRVTQQAPEAADPQTGPDNSISSDSGN